MQYLKPRVTSQTGWSVQFEQMKKTKTTKMTLSDAWWQTVPCDIRNLVYDCLSDTRCNCTMRGFNAVGDMCPSYQTAVLRIRTACTAAPLGSRWPNSVTVSQIVSQWHVTQLIYDYWYVLWVPLVSVVGLCGLCNMWC